MEECLAKSPPMSEKKLPVMNDESEEPSPAEESEEAEQEMKAEEVEAEAAKPQMPPAEEKPSSSDNYSLPEDGESKDSKQQFNDQN